MAETHELRLKIDAAAAKRGSAEFVGAVKAVQNAVRGLERDSTGVFKKFSEGIKKAQSGTKIKVASIDKNSVNAVESYANKLRLVNKAMTETRKGNTSLRQSVERVAASYGIAKQSLSTYNSEIIRNLALLKRQKDLAGTVATAMRNLPKGSSARAATPAQTVKFDTKSATDQEKMTRRIETALAAATLKAEGLTTSLMKVGGYKSLNEVGRALSALRKSLSGGEVSADEFARAMHNFGLSTKSAQTSLTTMRAKVADLTRAEREAAAAARAEGKALDGGSSSARAAAQEKMRLAQLTLSVEKAQRSAALSAQSLGDRMRAIGATGGLAKLESANTRFNQTLRAGVGNTLELRRAVGAYEADLHRLTLALTANEAAARRKAAAESKMAAAQRQIITNARQIERAMISQSGAAHATSRSFSALTGNMRGLENAFNATYQAGTVFRNMLGGLTLGTFVKSVYEAGTSVEQFAVTMQIATGSMSGAYSQMDFITNLARRFGTDLRTAREDFSKFAVASDLAGVAMGDTQKIFESVSMAMSVMGRGAEDQRLAFLALEQMMSKNTISSEELRRQLGERLPGAVNLMARAVGVSTAELNKMLKAGSLVSSEVLPKFAEEVNKAFGPGMEAATTRASRNLGTLKSEFELFLSAIADSGFMDVLASEFAQLTKMMGSGDIRKFARDIGHQLGTAAKVGSDALQFLVENVDSVREALSYLMIGFVATKGTQFIAFLATAGQQVAAMLSGLLGAGRGATSATVATDLYTAALARNAQVAALAAAAQARVSGSASAAAAAQSAAAAAAAAQTAAQVNGATGALGRFAGAAGVVARAAGVIAPILGIAGLAFAAYTIYTANASEATEEMEHDIEGALRRSGALFKDFSGEVRESAAEIAQAQNIMDFRALTSPLAESKVFEDAEERLQGLAVAVATMNGVKLFNPFDTLTGQGANSFLKEIGLSEEAVGRFSNSTKKMVQELWDGLAAVKQNTKSAAAYRIEIANMVAQNSQLQPIAKTFMSIADELLTVEVGANNARTALVKAMASPGQDALLMLANAGANALASGKGFDEFRQSVKDAMEDMPYLESQLSELLKRFDDARKAGTTGEDFRTAQLNAIAPGLAILDAETRLAEEARDKLNETAKKFSERTTGAGILMDAGDIGINISGDTYREFLEITEAFDDLNYKAAITKEVLATAFDALTPPTPEMRAFTTAVQEQFNALPEGQRNYEELSRLINETAASTQFAGTQASAYGDVLEEAARKQSGATMTAEQFGDAMRAMGFPQELVDQFINGLIDLADELATNAEASDKAADKVGKAAAAFQGAGASAANAAPGIMEFAKAMEAASAASAAMEGASTTFAEEMAKRTERAQLDGKEGEIFDALNDDNGIIKKALEDTDKRLAELMKARDGVSGVMAEKLNAEIRQLQQERDEAEAAMIRLYGDVLDSEEAADERRRAARKAERDANKPDKETDYAKRLRELSEARTESVASLREEALALQLVNSGQVSNLEVAQQIAAAKLFGNQKSIDAAWAYAEEAQALQALVEKEQTLLDVRKQGKDLLKNKKLELEAMKLLAEGQVETLEYGQMLAEAMATGDAMRERETRAIIKQAQAYDVLIEKMKKAASDPVKAWVDSVPTWKEAGDRIQTEAIGGLSDSLAEMMKTGEFSLEKLGESILNTAADIIADMAVKQLMDLIGLTGDEETGKKGFSLGNLFKKWFGGGSKTEDIKAPENTQQQITSGGQTASQLMQAGIVNGATQGAQLLATAISNAAAGINGKPLQGIGGVPDVAGSGGLSFGSEIGKVAPKGTNSILQYASKYIGMNEVVDNASLQKLLTVDPKITAWCADFVNQTLKAGGVEGTGKLNAKSFLNWGEDTTGQTQPGDLAIYDRGKKGDWQGHVGFVNSVNEDGTMDILGGNQSNGVSVQRMGSERLLGTRRMAGTDTLSGGFSGMFGEDTSGGMGGGGDAGAEALRAASQEMGETLRTAGTEVSTQLGEKITEGGQQMGQQVTQAGQTSATQMGAQVTQAGTLSATSMGTQVTTAGMMSGSSMGSSVQTSGSGAAMQMESHIVSGGAQAAAMMGAASGGGGAPSGGGMDWASVAVSAGMMIFSSILNKKKDKKEEEDEEEFKPVHSYSQGTANTSGIPAMLHQNEAVIPLTGNRKVPVQLEEGAGGAGGKQTVVNNTFHIKTQDADSFRRSQKQIAADMATSGQRAMNDNR